MAVHGMYDVIFFNNSLALQCLHCLYQSISQSLISINELSHFQPMLSIIGIATNIMDFNFKSNFKYHEKCEGSVVFSGEFFFFFSVSLLVH